jgi:hypothetical protein
MYKCYTPVTKILVLVDVQNLYFGAKNLDPHMSVDYNALKSVIYDKMYAYLNVNSESSFTLDFYGYVVQTPSYQGLNFFAFLKSIGYKLKIKVCGFKDEEAEKGSVGVNIQLDAVDMAADYNAVVVASGSGIFNPAFAAIKRNWPNVKCVIAAFKNTLHGSYRVGEGSPVDEIFILEQDVMKHDQ